MAIISNYIDIAPNEYFTKYSFNRNFNKLISNDVELNSYLNVNDTNNEVDKLNKAQSYNKNKVYSQGEFVFYKIQKYDTKFYILKSKINNNTHKPGVKQNEKTGEMYVVNTDYWTILGISENSGNARQKDKADVYINEKIYDFVNDHEQNTALSAHSTGKLGLRDSSKTFLTLENISEDRQKLFYPNTIQSFITDNTTYSGYMRKWDNGLLEYDIVFRLSYISSDESGRSLLSANNLVVPHSNKNFMYFKEDSDYEIFNRGGTGYIVTDTSKQVNLNSTMNAYSGKINFIEPFKDLNYMVFTSNNKVIEIESYDLNHEVLSGYDSRLVVNNRSIVGLKDGSIFKTPCDIPNKVINIADNAIEYAQKVGTEPVIFNIDPYQSQLVNIGDFAFNMSDIDHIVIPQSVKYIGQKAFNTCGYLTDVSIYLSDQVDLSSQQLYIGYKAFPSSVSSITIIYPPLNERSVSSQNDLYSVLLNNMSYRTNIGLNENLDEISIKSINRTDSAAVALAVKIEHANDFLPTTRTIALAAKSEPENEIDQPKEEPIISVSVEDFIAHLQEMKNENSLLKSSPKRTLLKAIRPEFDPINDINSLILMNNNNISGYVNNFVFKNIELNLSNLNTIPHCISSNSLNSFSYLTSLTSNVQLTGIQQNGLNFGTLKNLEIHLSTFNYDFNLSNSNIDTLTFIFEEQPTSLCVNLLNSNIQNFNLYGQNSNLKIISSMISTSNIDNFVVSGFSSYETSAFTHISSIDNATLYSSDTSVHTKIFGIDDEGDYVVNHLTLKNDSWTFGQNAFYGIGIDYLSIDMHNFKVDQGGYSFNNGIIVQLELSNSTPQLYSNLPNGALCSDYIGYAIIPDQNFNTITKQPISFFKDLSTDTITIVTSTLTAEPNTFFCTHNSWDKINYNEYYQISSINNIDNYQIYKINVTTGTNSLVKSIISSVTMLSDSYNNVLSIYGYNSTQTTGNANITYIDATYSATRSKMYKIQSPGTKLWDATKLLKLGFHDKTMIRFNTDYKFLSADVGLTKAVFIDAPNYFIKNSEQPTQILSINWAQWKETNSNVITIPYGITSIANNAFSTNNFNYISAVQQIIIPESISSIGESAFEGLLSTELVMFEPGISLLSIGNNAFNNCESLDLIKVIK